MSFWAGAAKLLGNVFAPGHAQIGKALGIGGAGKGMLGKMGDLGSMLGSGAGLGASQYQAQTVGGESQAGKADDKALNAQYQALDLTRKNTGQGFNAAERANLGLGINRVNQNTAARSNAINQNQMARGLGGAGLGLQLQAQNEQTGANAASMAGVEQQQNANQRALSSISQLGTLGADINEGAYNRGMAKDAFNQFNVAQVNAGLAGNAAGARDMLNSFSNNRYQSMNQKNIRADRNIKVGGGILGAAGAAMGGM